MSGNADMPDDSVQLARATWLLGLVVKRMIFKPDGSALVDLPAGMAAWIRQFVTEQAPKP